MINSRVTTLLTLFIAFVGVSLIHLSFALTPIVHADALDTEKLDLETNPDVLAAYGSPNSTDGVFTELAARVQIAAQTSISARDLRDVVQVDCSEAGLDAGLEQGGVITFNCTQNTVINLIHTKQISKSIVIDGGGKAVLNGMGQTQHFTVTSNVTLTVQNIGLIGGYAENGGAIYLDEGAGLEIYNSVVHSNTSTLDGGVIFAKRNSTIQIHNIDASYNTAIKGGGGVGSFKFKIDLSIEDSRLLSNTASFAGALEIRGSSVATITDSAFISNVSTTSGSGAIYAADMKSLIISHSQFVENWCQGEEKNIGDGEKYFFGGGAVLLSGVKNVLFDNVTFIKNVSVDTGGGAISIDYSNLVIRNSSFIDNTAPNGGAIFAASYPVLISSLKTVVEIEASEFVQNAALFSGGAVKGRGRNVAISARDSRFESNYAGDKGGGLDFVRYPGTNSGPVPNILLNRTSFINNYANVGGAVSGDFYLYIYNSTINDNHATTFGGGVYCNNICAISNTLLSNNRAIEGGGIAGSSQNLTNVTLSANQAITRGGAIFVWSTLNADNTTFFRNQAPEASSIYFDDGDAMLNSSLFLSAGQVNNCAGKFTVTSSYTFANDTSCNLTGTGDKQDLVDPMLSALDMYGGFTNVHMPLTGSPLIDAGECQSDVTTDQRLYSRPGLPGGKCDIGAVERGPTDKDTPWPKVFLPLITR